MTSQIKGLAQFIADIRTTSTPDGERARVQTELAGLRRKLAGTRAGKDIASKSKAGYEYRKVVSKLLYIYILGYDIDLGSGEVQALLSMPKFAEKQVGYLALSLLLNVRAELAENIAPTVESDLRSPNEVITSLALNYVSTYNLSELPLSEKLESLVYQLMVSPTSASAVAKKAALTFLNFYRQDPARFQQEPDWPDHIERISAILSSSSSGVSIAFVALLLEIARRSPSSFSLSVTRVLIQKLDDVFESGGYSDHDSNDYIYHDVTAPWLIAKLCELLTYLPIEAPEVLRESRSTAASLLAFCVDNMDDMDTPDREHGRTPQAQQHNSMRGSQQQKNAMSLVFVDVLKLANALHVEKWDPELAAIALRLVKSQFLSKDPNMRYLALEAVQSFATPLPKTSKLKRTESMRLKQQRRKNPESPVVPESPVSPDSVAATAGGDETDLIKIVLGLVKDRDISVRQQALDALYKLVDQHSVEIAAAELLDMLVSSDLQIRPQMVSRLAALIERFATSHEWYIDTSISLLVVGGTYASDEVWERLAQVIVNNQALQAYAVTRIQKTLGDEREIHSVRHTTANSSSEAIIKFSAFIIGEFAGFYGGDPIDLFVVLQDHAGAASWNTRSVLLTAYIKLAARFPHLRPAIADSLRLYLAVSDIEAQQRASEYLTLLQPQNADLLQLFLQPMPPFGKQSSMLLFHQMGESGHAESSKPQYAMHPLVPLTPVKTGRQPAAAPTPTAAPPRPLAATATGSSTRTMTLSSNWEYGFKRMLTRPEAVLYQDAILQIGCRYAFDHSRGRITLFIKNISSFDVSSINVTVQNPMSEETLALSLQAPTSTSLSAGRVVESFVFCEARQPFALAPTCRITYWAGSFGDIDIRLPIVLERFMTPSQPITFDQFQQRWNQVGNEFEFSKSVRNYSASKAAKNVDNDEFVLEGLQYGVVPAAPEGPWFGAGIIHTTGGMLGSLVVLQPDAQHQTYKVTVRATQKKLAAVILANNISQAYQL